MSDPLHDLERSLRFPPMMGGNTEVITVPCSLIRRMLGICQMAEAVIALPESDPRYFDGMGHLGQELAWLRMEVASALREPLRITATKEATP